MSELNTIQITIDGEVKNCNVLFTHYSDRFNKNYCFFEVEGHEDGGITVMSYDPNDGKEGMLHSVETDEEWQELEEVLEAWQEDDCGCSDDCGCDSGCSCCSGCSHE